MAKKVEVEVDIKGADKVKGLGQEIKELKKQLRSTPEGTKEWGEIFNKIDDLEDKQKAARKANMDWIDSLESAPGPLGAVGKGLNNVKVATQSWGAALKATGIGLIVSLIGGLVAAFSQTEETGKKLQPLLIGFERIFKGIFRALEPVFDTLVELATQAMPYVTKAFGVAYSAVASFLQGLGMLGRAIGKLIKGDFAGAWEDAKGAVTGFGDRYDEANKRFIAGTQEVTKTEKKNLKERTDNANDALQKKIARMDAEDKLEESELEKKKARNLAEAKSEQEKLDAEKSAAKEAYNAQLKNLEDKQKLYAKDSNEWKNLQAEKNKLEGDFISQSAGFAEKQKEINDKKNQDLLEEEIQALEKRKAKGEISEKEYQDALIATKRKYITDKKVLGEAEISYEEFLTEEKEKLAKQEQQIAFQTIQGQIDDLDRLSQQKDNDFAEDIARAEQKKKFLEEQRDMELKAAEKDAAKQFEIRKKYGDQINAVEKTITDTKKAQEDARYEIALAAAQALQQVGAFMQSIAGENKKLAKTGLFIEKAGALAIIAINAKKNFIKDGGATSPKAWINLALAGIQAAGVVAAAIKGARDIDAAGSGGSGGGGADSAGNMGRNYERGGMIRGKRHAQGGTLIEAEEGEAIMTRGAVTMFRPMLSMMNQMGGGTSFNSNVVTRPDAPALDNPAMSKEPPIIKTYVVESELTNEQQKQARLKDLSTL